MLLSLCSNNLRALFVSAAVLGMSSAVGATEDTPDHSLTVVRQPTVGEEIQTTRPLAPGTLSVIPATTDTEELTPEEKELQEEDETETVPYASLPEAVRAAAERELGGRGDYRAARSGEQGTPIYQVSAIKDGLAVELILTEEGEISFVTREIPFSRLPLAVQSALRQKNPDGKFTSIQAVTAHAYTATLRGERGEEIELRVEPSGLIESDEQPIPLPESVE